MKCLPALTLLLALPLPAADFPTLHARIEARLARRADLAKLGQPPPELQQVAWMVGTWEVASRNAGDENFDHGVAVVSWVVGGCWLQSVETYPTGVQDLGFTTYEPVGRQWLALALDSVGNAVKITAPGWTDNRLVFVARDIEIVGEKVTLRQTLTKLSPDEFTVTNEELLPDGTWRAIDEYRYRRASPARPAP